MNLLPGILFVVIITIVAGGIAYIGDRVGHQVGRKRLTLFGLRPKYTSTIVAVGTGMLIALSVTLLAIAASGYVRMAFFRLGQLNAQINQLQAQAVAQQHELDTTRKANLVLPVHVLIAPAAVIDMRRTPDEQLRAISTFFDDTVRYVNRTYANGSAGLAPYRKSSSDPTVRANLVKLLADSRDEEATAGDTGIPMLFVPVAATNLFRGETISFNLPSWPDKRLASAGDEIASVEVEGGKQIAAPDYLNLANRSFQELAKRQFPFPFFASPPSGFDPVRFQAASAELARVHGRFRLVSRTETNLYPHTGGFILAVSIEPLH
jgi:Protein of unknown function (DUF3084)